jgi:hypothetical protein
MTKQTYVSFDVATKSLGVAIVKLDFTPPIIPRCIDDIVRIAKQLDQDTDNNVKFRMISVKDLIPGKKTKDTSEVERSFQLNKYLQSIANEISCLDSPTFLIEYQMGPNNKSRFISAQIIMFCTNFCTNSDQIKLIGPSLKNKFYFPSDPLSRLEYYLDKYSSNYTANKNHTKYCFLKILRTYKQSHLIKNIAKKNIDDAADAAMMAIAYHLFKFIRQS